jgi:hypothetical protein
VNYLHWFNNTAGAQATFSVDDIAFVASGLPTPTPLGPTAGPALQVDAASGRHAISELIYGMNFADEALATALRLPVRRWGGNATTRYNWRTDTSNRAADWYFENIPNDNANPAALPDGSSSDLFVEENLRAGAETLLTIPLIGWTPRGRAYGCGFSVAKVRRAAVGRSLPQRLRQRRAHQRQRDHRQQPRRRQRRDRTGLRAAVDAAPHRPLRQRPRRRRALLQPRQRAHALGRHPPRRPSRSAELRRAARPHVRLRRRDQGDRSDRRDARPGGVGLERLLLVGARRRARRRLVEQPAGPARARQPAAHRLVSPATRQLPAAARRAPARLPRPPLLSAGQRRLVVRRRRRRHAGAPAAFDAVAVGRVVRRRELDQRAVRLIPRMRDWVAQYYPGTKLAIGEYNWGALDHINGALAQADVLGIFGREGMGLATLWAPPTASQPAAFAFRMYRNYDGAGGAFGDVGVTATSADQATVAVYAAQRTADGALTIMAINKTAQPQTTALTVGGFAATGAGRVYRYAPTNLAAIERLSDITVSSGTNVTWAPQSITVLVLPGAAGPQATPTSTFTATPVPPSATRTATGTGNAHRHVHGHPHAGQHRLHDSDGHADATGDRHFDVVAALPTRGQHPYRRRPAGRGRRRRASANWPERDH